jgi:hypothetical protein
MFPQGVLLKHPEPMFLQASNEQPVKQYSSIYKFLLATLDNETKPNGPTDMGKQKPTFILDDYSKVSFES